MGLLEKLPFKELRPHGWPWNTEVDPEIYNAKAVWPKISIVTPSYNQGKFIEETIRSVLLQNYPNLEYIVIDGGSTDDTIDIIKKYEEWIAYWVSEKDDGQSEAINKGLARCTGDIFNWLNSDDYILPDALYYIGNYLWEESVGALVGKGYKIDLDKNIIYTPRSKKLGYNAFLNWMQGNNFMQPACFFSKKAWKYCGPLDEDLNFCMDVDLWLKMAKKFDFKRLDYDIAFAYAHSDAKTTAYSFNSKIETALLIYKNGYKKLAINEVKRTFNYALGEGSKSIGLFSQFKHKLRNLLRKNA